MTGFILIGLAILALNTWGLFRGNKYLKSISQENQENPIFGRTKKIDDLSLLNRHQVESESEYLERLRLSIGQHMIHYPLNKDSLSFSRNWLLWALRATGLSYFKFYEFYDGYKALERGYGFCSQFSIVIWFFLMRAGIKASVLRLQGHIINQVFLEGGLEVLVDADYQIMIPYSLEHVRVNPTLIDQYYGSFENKALLKTLYLGNYDVLSSFHLNIRLLLERLLFILKWIIPLAFLGMAYSQV